jgi:hypothetical protein
MLATEKMLSRLSALSWEGQDLLFHTAAWHWIQRNSGNRRSVSGTKANEYETDLAYM